MPHEPTPTDLLMARHARRKVDAIVTKTYREFRKIIREYETLSADEIFAIGVNLTMLTTVLPLEKMTDVPAQLRAEITKQFALFIERGTVETN